MFAGTDSGSKSCWKRAKDDGPDRVSVPKARNVIAWASGPGFGLRMVVALKAQNMSRNMSPLQGLHEFGALSSRGVAFAMPLAITSRAFGAEDQSSNSLFKLQSAG